MTDNPITIEDVQNDVRYLKDIKTSPLTSDYIVTPMPHLAIITLDEFAEVLDIAKEYRLGPTGQTGKGRLHPLVSKWFCPRCGSMLRLNGASKWLRCEGTNAHRLGWSPKPTCDAPPIDLGAAEGLMFRALETFRNGREGSFSKIARSMYDQVVQDSLSDRRRLDDEIAFRKSKLKSLAEDLDTFRNNRGFVEALMAQANEHNDRLEAAIIELQDLRSIPEESDPETSLLELDNMMAELRTEGPFGFEVNDEALSLRNRLRDLVHAVTMVELGDDRYDVEFQIDVSAVFESKASSIERVTFNDVPMKGGNYRTRKRKASIKADVESGKHALSDKEWKSRPPLPCANAQFGGHMRWVLDMLIVIAEWNGAVSALNYGDARVASRKILYYRRTAETEEVAAWLQRIRPRSHGYRFIRPGDSNMPTLRQRFGESHPLMELKRFEESTTQAPLTDDEFESLLKKISVNRNYKMHFRLRVDQLIDMLRRGNSEVYYGRQGLGKWMACNHKRGKFQTMVNFFRMLEGKPAVSDIPLPAELDMKAKRS